MHHGVHGFNDTWENQEFPPAFFSLSPTFAGRWGEFEEATHRCLNLGLPAFLATKFQIF